MKKYSVIFLLAFLCLKLNAQVTGDVNGLDRDMFYFNYIPPNVISPDFSYQRLSGKLSLPPIRRGNLSLFNTMGVDVHTFKFHDDSIDKNTEQLGKLYNVNLSIFAQYRLSEKWTINALATPFVASNFAEGVSLGDLKFNGNIFLERTFFLQRGGYLQAGLGAAYITLNGRSSVVPITHIKARLSRKWSFVLGIPNTYVKWDFSKRQSIKALVDLNDISASVGYPGRGLHTYNSAVFTVASGGLEYNYWVTPSVGLMIRAHHAIWDNYELRDGDDIATHHFDSSLRQPFITVGVKYNPIRKLQNSLNPL